MARLTERRFEQAKPILDRYRDQMRRWGRIDNGRLESELRSAWGMGYQELKDVVIDLSHKSEYSLIAAYYMQFSNPSGPVCEFHDTLAAMYGAAHWYAEDREAKQRAFWEAASGPDDPG